MVGSLGLVMDGFWGAFRRRLFQEVCACLEREKVWQVKLSSPFFGGGGGC